MESVLLRNASIEFGDYQSDAIATQHLLIVCLCVHVDTLQF